MDTEEIRNYAKLMKDLGLTGMEVKGGDYSIRLEMEQGRSAVQTAPVDSPAVSGPAATAVKDEDARTLEAKFVGIFYESPSENDPPYVKVGDRVGKGSVVCIIEAMKLINEIAMDEDGVITEVCAKHGQLVEYGTPLFKYRVAR